MISEILYQKLKPFSNLWFNFDLFYWWNIHYNRSFPTILENEAEFDSRVIHNFALYFEIQHRLLVRIDYGLFRNGSFGTNWNSTKFIKDLSGLPDNIKLFQTGFKDGEADLIELICCMKDTSFYKKFHFWSPNSKTSRFELIDT